ncbi:hypothetical protein DEO72_LG11g220 [Vigna unguiculata]|uniref:Uncharacterized protein n=1 Tax=Vigna unguiculata TaxID=3917 RepID=A0A4D6NMZ7_VIGUN|nr:hypothetical protein DEO72_LG11g220 [Vigna unguiculata]
MKKSCVFYAWIRSNVVVLGKLNGLMYQTKTRLTLVNDLVLAAAAAAVVFVCCGIRRPVSYTHLFFFKPSKREETCEVAMSPISPPVTPCLLYTSDVYKRQITIYGNKRLFINVEELNAEKQPLLFSSVAESEDLSLIHISSSSNHVKSKNNISRSKREETCEVAMSPISPPVTPCLLYTSDVYKRQITIYGNKRLFINVEELNAEKVKRASVSYTQLDVYKRQLQAGVFRSLTLVNDLVLAAAAAAVVFVCCGIRRPVSYTHLFFFKPCKIQE